MSLSKEEKSRYSRHLILQGFGEDAQQKLKNGRVLVVGAGGLGCPVLLYLTAAGVGNIGIADDDLVSNSNLQRQVLFTVEDIGRPKAQVAVRRLAEQNPHIEFYLLCERITRDNALQILKGYDVIVDCTDNLATRYLLNDACVILQKPLVYGAVFKFEGQVSVFNLGAGPTYRCLFPVPPSQEASCSEVGVVGVLPGIVGTWQASETIKIITGIGQPLCGRLLSFDLLTNDFHVFRFNAIPANKEIKSLGNYSFTCETLQAEIDATTLNNWMGKGKEVQIIDVREPDEYRQHNIGGKNIPLSTIANINNIEISLLESNVVVCQSGVRSAKAIGLLQALYPNKKFFNLKGGLNHFD